MNLANSQAFMVGDPYMLRSPDLRVTLGNSQSTS